MRTMEFIKQTCSDSGQLWLLQGLLVKNQENISASVNFVYLFRLLY